MRAICILMAVASAVCANAAQSPAVAPEAAARLIESITSGDALLFNLDPAFGTVEKRSQRAASAKIDTTITTTGGYTLKLTGDNSAGLLKLKFTLSRRDKRAFTTKSYGIRVDTAAIPVLKGAEFYHAHKMDLATADFRPIGNAEYYPNYVIEGKDTAYVYSATLVMPALDLKRAPRVMYVFNSSKGPRVGLDIGGLRPGKYQWEARDCRMGSVSRGEIEVTGNRLAWDAPAPAGGMVELHCPPD